MSSSQFHLPRFSDLPSVPLYKEQVITYVEGVLAPFLVTPEDKVLTPSMLNSYVKQKIVLPPKDNKYTKSHIAYLIVVCILKQAFTLHEICFLIKFHVEKVSIPRAYNYFCKELEMALDAAFYTQSFSYPNFFPLLAEEITLLRSTAMVFAHKLLALSLITKYEAVDNLKLDNTF